MGWSADARACRTMDEWTRVCVAQGGTQNVYKSEDGTRFMWERGNREHADGAITGQTWRFVPGGITRAGSWRIEPDGSVSRWPQGFRVVTEIAAALAKPR